jgi:hypothetical protein
MVMGGQCRKMLTTISRKAESFRPTNFLEFVYGDH